MVDIKEECGIAGGAVFNKKNIVPYLYKMTLNLQNRGQLSCGISTYNEKRDLLISTYKDIGNVNEVFKLHKPDKTFEIFDKYSGDRGIAHTRYATSGMSRREEAHPMERTHGRKYKWFSMCFNGNIANYTDLRRTLLAKKDYHMIYNTDTEIIMHNISKTINILDTKTNHGPELVDVFSSLKDKFDGAYNIGMIQADGQLAALRDPMGFKPLCYSVDNEKVLFASESVALNQCGVDGVKFLQPGEILVNEKDNTKVERFAKCEKKAHCMFEWIYFANIGSVLDNKSVYEARTNLGKHLAKSESLEVDDDTIVLPVPDSSRPFGDAFAFELGIPSKEGLVRNRYVGRTFIEGHSRKGKVEDKFNIIKDVTRDKKILLLDDSIVRGNTSRSLVNFVRNKGQAKEVHLRVSCPPILAPCFYGIDMSTINELIATHHFKDIGEDISEEACSKIAEDIGADSVVYQKMENIPKSIGIPKCDLCMACLNGEYPTEWGCKLFEKAKQNSKKGVSKRTYEC